MTNSRKKSGMLWLGVGAAVAIGLGALLWLGGGSSEPTAVLSGAISSTDHVKGNRDAKVVLVEYGDFQCPACAAYNPLVNQLVSDFGDRIALIYRNFPLRPIHPNADASAYAAEAAALQGKFWEMHDLLFSRQSAWEKSPNPQSIFEGYAKELGLDVNRWKSDTSSDAVKTKVENDLESALNARLAGTPTFFLNGEQLENPNSYQEFAMLIQAALAQNP